MRLSSLHYRTLRQTGDPFANFSSSSRSFDTNQKDWYDERDVPKRYTYLSMWGGSFSFERGAEKAAREAIAVDLNEKNTDYRGHPLALELAIEY